MQKYTHTYTVRGCDMDPEYRLRKDILISYMFDCSSRECQEVGMATFDLQQERRTWVLTDLRIDYLTDKMPYWRGEVKIETWSRPVKGLRWFRDFEAYYNGVLIARATTCWSIIDEDTRRPVYLELPSVKFVQLPELVFPDYKPAKLQPIERTDFSSKFKVRAFDIDFNMHLTSMRYIEEALEAVPLEQTTGKSLERIEIKYMRECYLHDEITVSVEKQAEGFAHQLYSLDKESEVSRMVTVWN